MPRKITRVKHELDPVFNTNSKILILGSLPSVKSREDKFYYAHPQNRFWKVLEEIFNEKIENSINSKKDFLYKHNIALWDVIESCYIYGSSDSSIRDVIANDISFILKNSEVDRIYTTGKKAYELYNKYCFSNTKIKATYLPSTSGANASISFQQLINEYKKITN